MLICSFVDLLNWQMRKPLIFSSTWDWGLIIILAIFSQKLQDFKKLPFMASILLLKKCQNWVYDLDGFVFELGLYYFNTNF